MQIYNTYAAPESPAMRILFATLDLGEAMLASGGEVRRVEDTISRILRAYGAGRVEVFTITTSIIVTVQSEEWGTLTQTRRISGQKFNLTRLCALNQLSRRVCRELLPPDEFDAALAECAHTPSTSATLMPLAWALVSASFSMTGVTEEEPATTTLPEIPQADASSERSTPASSVPSTRDGICVSSRSVAASSSDDHLRAPVSSQEVPAESDISEMYSPVSHSRR